MTRRVHSLHYLCQLLEIGERHSLTNACLMELAGLLQEIVPELPSLGTDGKLQVLWPTTTSLTVGVNQMLASQPSASSSNHFLDPNETTSEVFASRPTASTSNLFLDIHEKTSAQGALDLSTGDRRGDFPLIGSTQHQQSTIGRWPNWNGTPTLVLVPQGPQRTIFLENLSEVSDTESSISPQQASLSVKYLNISRASFPKKLYLCENCHRGFDGYHLLKQHNKIHEDGRTQYCCGCPMYFSDAVYLREHTLREHGSGELQDRFSAIRRKARANYVCDICHVVFVQQHQLLGHKRAHAPDKHNQRCAGCSDVFNNPDALRRHTLDEHGFTTFPPLPFSRRSFKKKMHPFMRKQGSSKDKVTQALLRSALQKARDHALISSTTGALNTVETSSASSSKQTTHEVIHPRSKWKHTCGVCGLRFQTLSELGYHSRTSPCCSAERTVTFADYRRITDHAFLSSVQQSDQGAARAGTTCPVCWTTFASTEEVEAHVIIHTAGQRQTCMVCSAVFHAPAALKWHMENLHVSYKTEVGL